MMKIQFGKATWRRGTNHKVDAQKAHEELERIRANSKDGLTTEAVVAAAKSKRNPLHNEFEWDDTVAANQHRLHQARNVINSLKVYREESPNRPAAVYEGRYQPSPSGQRPKKKYRPLSELLADPDDRAELLARALRELIAVRQRYHQLQELAIVFRSIDTFVEEFEEA